MACVYLLGEIKITELNVLFAGQSPPGSDHCKFIMVGELQITIFFCLPPKHPPLQLTSTHGRAYTQTHTGMHASLTLPSPIGRHRPEEGGRYFPCPGFMGQSFASQKQRRKNWADSSLKCIGTTVLVLVFYNPGI